MNHEEYHATKIRPLIQLIAQLVKNNPALADDNEYLWAQACHIMPELADTSRCYGCNRSMKVTVYEADLLDALLVLTMAREVRRNMEKGEPFTQANKIHIPTLRTTQGILKRQTKCDYLDLIKQQPKWKGSGYWALTSWAWKLLRGESIPAKAKYWEGNLLGRSEETTTMARMFQTHRDLVSRAIAKRGHVKSDHREMFADYTPHDWVNISRFEDQQELL